MHTFLGRVMKLPRFLANLLQLCCRAINLHSRLAENRWAACILNTEQTETGPVRQAHLPDSVISFFISAGSGEARANTRGALLYFTAAVRGAGLAFRDL